MNKYRLINTILNKKNDSDKGIVLMFTNNLTINIYENLDFRIVKVIYVLNGQKTYFKLYKKNSSTYFEIKREIFRRFGQIIKWEVV